MIDLDKTCTVCGGWVADYGPEYGWMHIVSQYDNAPHDVVLAGEAESKRQDHLPECPLCGTCENSEEHDPRDMPDWCQVCDQRCICLSLRACYQRALDAAREAVDSMVIETVGNSAATVEQAVSVIDALREET